MRRGPCSVREGVAGGGVTFGEDLFADGQSRHGAPVGRKLCEGAEALPRMVTGED